jgi:hypothetical protein
MWSEDCTVQAFVIIYLKMETLLHIDITYEPILSLVKQMPIQQKRKLSKELEKENVSEILKKLINFLIGKRLFFIKVKRLKMLFRKNFVKELKNISRIIHITTSVEE